MTTFVSTHRSGLALSMAAHVLILVALSTSLVLVPNNQLPMLAIEAVLIDTSAIRKAAEAERRQQEAEAERRREEQLRDAEQERLRKAEVQRQQVERERKEAEARKARQQREAEARVKQEQERKAAEARAKAEAERRAAEARAAEQARRQAELVAAMEAEEALERARASGEMSRYIALIQQKVERNWTPPGNVREGLECEVVVQQLPNGDVIDAQTVSCNGDATVRRSIENAVRRSSPLPLPENRALFERNLRFVFKPQQ
ncbi:MAG: cell envelope integrity protein TolA [Gammaproteobacteria bacterium]|nr:cell envelope integrity protein TolA [Gammaproteobacteria bacterium]MDP6616492.1 cell envelope integrity protein TolA [Gammaproteobacteria bacterium]MDP6694259.1 cell envelope integrity protein TolA [Gammaproteobacteria bacterium]MDP7041503.1 cell envelope integrity protein TolA [Gammaproteobacteria bacterium]